MSEKMTVYDELVARGLIAQVTDEKEIKEMINEGKTIEMNCHFCNKHYPVTVEELKDVLDDFK